MRALVCGGRDYSDRRSLYGALDKLHSDHLITALIAGGARGADSLAADWAGMRSIPATIYNADWEAHGRKAGPIRNQRMLDDGKPDLVVAFPGGKGTADLVARAERAGVEIMRVPS